MTKEEKKIKKFIKDEVTCVNAYAKYHKGILVTILGAIFLTPLSLIHDIPLCKEEKRIADMMKKIHNENYEDLVKENPEYAKYIRKL